MARTLDDNRPIKKKVKRIRNYDLKFNLYRYFLTEQKLLIHGKKMWMPAELKGYVIWFI